MTADAKFRTMNALAQPTLARDEAIAEALYDATCDGDGRPRPNALAHHLAKHGLVIVDVARPLAQTFADLIDAAMESAIENSLSNGPWADEIAHELRRRGLLIVEAARHDKLTATMQFVGSALVPIVENMSERTFQPDVRRALRGVVAKIKEI